MDNLFILAEDVVKTAPTNSVTLDLPTYRENLQVKVMKLNHPDMEFDIIGINPALVNAFRRILISDVPTMAIEKVTMHQNKTVIQDEVLAHRLGLIPLKANPKLFQYRLLGDQTGTDRDSLHYSINVKCTKNPLGRVGHYRPEDLYVNHQVLSSDIKWMPIGGQSRLYKEEDVGPVNDDILIAKMRPGHELHVTMVAVKSCGRDHAKFSPVGTASYRLLPYIKLLEDVEGEDARTLQRCFSTGVISLEERNGKTFAKVENPRIDMCSRNVLNEPHLKNKVVLGRVKDHYIFTIESTVATPPDELFKEAVKIMKKKCTDALAETKKFASRS
uniref:DNA-directed RNA polymerases I and III subunit RPAC1 n=2 Tax=Lygus hesperus TaxID=30085 RepID=A0A0A9WBW0_LYGHE